MPQGVGLQVSSSRTSEPMFGFGSAGREHVAKVFVSEDHNKSLFGIDSPGPQVYTLQSAVGRQELSEKGNQPAWVFGCSNRFQYEHVKRAATSPGPGAYTLQQSVGSQVASTKSSSPMPGFGTSNRDQMSKLYISSEHEKAQSGNNSPGPCNYALPEATGRQPLSKYSSMPSWGFGKSSRCAHRHAPAPRRARRTPAPAPPCLAVPPPTFAPRHARASLRWMADNKDQLGCPGPGSYCV